MCSSDLGKNTSTQGGASVECDGLSILRERSNTLTRPVLLVNYDCESQKLAPLKDQLSQRIQQWKTEKKVTRASVFYKEMNSVHWTGVNQHDGYYPGSLLKLALLINVLKLSESNPSLLDQRILFSTSLNMPVKEAPENPLLPGKEIGRAHV